MSDPLTLDRAAPAKAKRSPQKKTGNLFRNSFPRFFFFSFFSFTRCSRYLDGLNQMLVRYDLSTGHGLGVLDHRAANIRRYMDVQVPKGSVA